jgi:hypothetical protein
MKNIHLIPTDKPSRLSILNSGKLNFGAEIMSSSNSKPQHIYIISDEEIKEGDWYFITESISKCESKYEANDLTDICKKIILTTDQDLIKDGVQAIDDEFLEWFVKNPSCEEVEVEKTDTFKKTNEVYIDEITGGNYYEVVKQYKIIIPNEEPKQIKCYCGHTTMCDCSPIEEPKDVVLGYKTSLDAQMLDKIEPKQETLEKAAHKMLMDYGIMSVGESINVLNVKKLMVLFAKEQQERSYSEEEVRNLFRNYQYDSAQFAAIMEGDTDGKPTPTGWFEKFKKK